jgi:hypothetical protein
MRFIKSSVAAIGIALLLSACSNSPQSSSPDYSTGGAVQEINLVGSVWEADEYLTPNKVASQLIRAGICDEIIESSADNAVCMTEYPTKQSERCPSNVHVTAGASATFYNPKRPLSYEDGMSVALFYGENYQVEISPLDSFENSDTLISNCSSKVEVARNLIGGSVTVYGQYDTYPEDEQVETPDVEQVSMPDLVGSIDGNARNWLRSNGYDFNFDIKSTGFNAQISCLMSGDNYIVAQEPSAGSAVENSFSTSVVVYVDCEW